VAGLQKPAQLPPLATLRAHSVSDMLYFKFMQCTVQLMQIMHSALH
jgi:hypothetical protein